MARKTCLKRLCTKGQLPLSLEVQRHVNADETVRRSLDADPIHAMDIQPGILVPTTDGEVADGSGWVQTEIASEPGAGHSEPEERAPGQEG
jgi:recombinational DNA repair protein RecT